MSSPRLLLGCLLPVFAGCGGGQGDAVEAPSSAADSARFLTRATFGPDAESIEHLLDVGYLAWFDEQEALPPSLIRPALEAELLPDPADVFENDVRRKELWWGAVIDGPDQLRQRMAWALGQILVVSTQDIEVFDVPLGVAEYQDILVRHALGNYRDLLGEVTRSPVMGIYLDMLQNAKGDPAQNLRPDENYAREILQLFSIGLVRLAPDGTPQLDGQGQPIPTYDQAVVEGFACVFTGWTYGTVADFYDTPADQVGRGVVPMQAFEGFHEPGEKLLLDGVVLPPGLGAEADLEAALDLVFAHPNVGPFVSRLLIQRLVTSNPGPGYVARVAAAFDDDGDGVRGNLAAVARAILLDPEARTPADQQPESFGKLREPLLRLTSLWRAFDAEPTGGAYSEIDTMLAFGQGPQEAPSVFNFFDPDYAPVGELSDAGLAAPEFQVTTHRGIAESTNRLFERVLEGYQGYPWAGVGDELLDLEPWLAVAADPELLVAGLDTLLMAGSMSFEQRAVTETYAALIPLDFGASDGLPAGLQRVVEVVALIVTSPQAAVLR